SSLMVREESPGSPVSKRSMGEGGQGGQEGRGWGSGEGKVLGRRWKMSRDVGCEGDGAHCKEMEEIGWREKKQEDESSKGTRRSRSGGREIQSTWETRGRGESDFR